MLLVSCQDSAMNFMPRGTSQSFWQTLVLTDPEWNEPHQDPTNSCRLFEILSSHQPICRPPRWRFWSLAIFLDWVLERSSWMSVNRHIIYMIFFYIYADIFLYLYTLYFLVMWWLVWSVDMHHRGGHIYLWELAGKTALCHLGVPSGSVSVPPKRGAMKSIYYSTKIRFCSLKDLNFIPIGNLFKLWPKNKIWHLCMKACSFTKTNNLFFPLVFFKWIQSCISFIIDSFKSTPLITNFWKTWFLPSFQNHLETITIITSPFRSSHSPPGHIDTEGGKVNSLAVNPGSIGQVLAAGEDGTVRVYAQR